MAIRNATKLDLSRIAEIHVFNNRINYYPIFKDISYSFGYMQVTRLIDDYFGKEDILKHLYVCEDEGVVKGYAEIKDNELMKLYVDPCLLGNGIGAKLIEFAVSNHNVNYLWALEKNTRAISFYHRHGFYENGERKNEPETIEYAVKLVRK